MARSVYSSCWSAAACRCAPAPEPRRPSRDDRLLRLEDGDDGLSGGDDDEADGSYEHAADFTQRLVERWGCVEEEGNDEVQASVLCVGLLTGSIGFE